MYLLYMNVFCFFLFFFQRNILKSTVRDFNVWGVELDAGSTDQRFTASNLSTRSLQHLGSADALGCLDLPCSRLWTGWLVGWKFKGEQKIAAFTNWENQHGRLGEELEYVPFFSGEYWKVRKAGDSLKPPIFAGPQILSLGFEIFFVPGTCKANGLFTRNSTSTSNCWRCKSQRIRSGFRPPNDADPRHPGIKIFTTDSFEELLEKARWPFFSRKELLERNIITALLGRFFKVYGIYGFQLRRNVSSWQCLQIGVGPASRWNLLGLPWRSCWRKAKLLLWGWWTSMKTRLTGLERLGMSAQDGEIFEVLCKDAWTWTIWWKLPCFFKRSCRRIPYYPKALLPRASHPRGEVAYQEATCRRFLWVERQAGGDFLRRES